ncbi:MAG: hypothetical protein [Bacteriophage sp.]|nr:MAG: hypothetical protein [Bacteriophage sp.]
MFYLAIFTAIFITIHAAISLKKAGDKLMDMEHSQCDYSYQAYRYRLFAYIIIFTVDVFTGYKLFGYFIKYFS